jgi:hypothetical protein
MQQEKSNSNNLTNLLEEQSIAWPELFKSKLTLKGKNGEFQDIDVSFVQKYYKSRKIPMVAFQLVESTNNEIAFSRPVYETFHGESHLGNYSLVKNSTGDGYYFSWTDYFSRLCLITIPDIIPNGKYTDDPNVGFFANSPNDPLMRGGVDHIIGMQGYFEGWERFFKGGGGVASAREANNVLTLTVTNAAGSKFTFSNQDGQWHAYSFWGEISRIKPTP